MELFRSLSMKNKDIVYESSWFQVEKTQLPDKEGNLHDKYAILHPGAVIILPLVDDDIILLIQNERFAVNKTLWELPAGTREAEEKPIYTAERELLEETGFRCQEIEPLCQFYSSPGFCNEQIHGFVARDLCFEGQKLDPTERITVNSVSIDEALEMVQDGRIEDAKTMNMLMYYQLFRRSQ